MAELRAMVETELRHFLAAINTACPPPDGRTDTLPPLPTWKIGGFRVDIANREELHQVLDEDGVLIFDASILVCAVDKDSPFHEPCGAGAMRAPDGPSPAALTRNVYYEVPAIAHACVRVSLAPSQAWSFLEA